MKKVADILKEKREEQSLSIEDVHNKTKISIEHLQKIEKGAWQSFGSYAYLQGIIRKYAAFLKLDVLKVLSYLKRESGTQQTRFIRSLDYQDKNQKVRTNWLMYFALLLVLVFFLIQFFLSWRKPLLVLRSIPSNISRNEPLIISGKTQQGVLLYLNEEQIYQNDKGEFMEKIYLKKIGERKVIIKAIGINGKEQEQIIVVNVQ